ncbi:MAG: hypothetical protein ACRDVP_04480 [Acidimicrobiales bacterium]
MSEKQARRARQQARARRAALAAREAQAGERERSLDSLSHRRKLAWAGFHTDEVEAIIQEWVDDGGYRVFQEPDGQGGSRLMAEMLKPLPDELGLIIGDGLQALRNSLDNLAFALARAHTPVMSPSDERQVSFPIFDNAAAVGAAQIKLMEIGAQKTVCDLCPDPNQAPVDQHPLWLLNKTANRDKHREIHVVAVGYGVRNMRAGSGYISSLTTYNQLLQPGEPAKPIVEVGAGTTMNMYMSHGLHIAFAKGVEVEDREVVPTLRWFHDHIRDTVFQRLEPHLT